MCVGLSQGAWVVEASVYVIAMLKQERDLRGKLNLHC